MRPSLPHAASSFALLLGLGGCAPVAAIGRLTDEGFEHARHDYRVAYADPDTRTLLSDDWVLDNYGPERDGALGTPKGGDLYQYTIELDTNGDGTFETSRTVFGHDLLFRHRRTGASLWVRTILASPWLEERDLRVVVHDYVDGIAGTSGTVVALERPMMVSRDRRLAARVVQEADVEFHGHAAYMAVIDLVNLDQRELTSEAVWERSEIVVLRPGFAEQVGATLFPVLMAVGVVARPEDFPAHEADLHDLLSRITIGERGRLAELRDPVLTCFPDRETVLLRVRSAASGSSPPTVVRGHGWSDAELACVEGAVRGHDLPPSREPRVFGAVFERELPVAEGAPAYGDPDAPPPPGAGPAAPTGDAPTPAGAPSDVAR